MTTASVKTTTGINYTILLKISKQGWMVLLCSQRYIHPRPTVLRLCY